MRNIFTILIVTGLCVMSFVAIGFKDNSVTENANTNAPVKTYKKVYDIIAEKKNNNNTFSPVSLFKYDPAGQRDAALNNFVSSSATLKLQKNAVSSILRSAPENIEFSVPVSETESMVLELTKVQILTEDFHVMDGEGSILPYTPGVYYRGIIKGDNKSLASLSINETMVMGFASNHEGNYVLGSVKEGAEYTDNYIYYNDADLLVENKFECAIDDENKFRKYNNTSSVHEEISTDNPAARAPVRSYFVADYQMYLDGNQNSTSVVNFVTGAFNQVATIYANENLEITMSPMRVLTSAAQDPYRLMTASDDILFAFGDNTQDNFTGDLAHLLSTRNAGLGGIAWIGVLCQSYFAQEHFGRFAFSNIDPEYQPYPTHSWTVNVIAHEMGHNFGSNHTHSCTWPTGAFGGLGAIDSCYFAEGGCFSGRHASPVGTIMSYCHLYTTGGVNFQLGFGPLPGDTIRLRYNQASCFGPVTNSSELPITFDLLQNYPNPFNPATNIKFALPVNAMVTLKVYDMSGRLVANLLDGKFFNAGIFVQAFNTLDYNLASGIYFYRLDAVDPAKGNQKVFMEVKKMVLVK